MPAQVLCFSWAKGMGFSNYILNPMFQKELPCPTVQDLGINDCSLNLHAPELGSWQPWVRPSTPLPQFLYMENEVAVAE